MQRARHHELTTMNPTNLRVLQVNIMKSRACMEALINDPQTNNLDVLLVQEPPIIAYRTHVFHRSWHLYRPTYADDGTTKRSLIYVNKRISTSAHRQIHCNHPDVTAVKIWNDETQMLLFSVYAPPINYYQPVEPVAMQPTLDEIQACIREVTRSTDKSTTLTLAGDFNRHHPAWSGNEVHHRVMAQADELINFIHA